MRSRKGAETQRLQDQEINRLKQELAQLQGVNGKLHSELLQERITRIDFQVQLLTQWRQRCQEELNRMLAGQGQNTVPEELAQVSGRVEGS
ncbi:MAG: hypothetical protein C4567_12410 [Deltaproteobacteria bacterium]|nr:MAG: hypothetical protein C4567_12410 [Deltaproteobacteria bacterium]